jgi:hypothetical protein
MHNLPIFIQVLPALGGYGEVAIAAVVALEERQCIATRYYAGALVV